MTRLVKVYNDSQKERRRYCRLYRQLR
jgi:hypothetical protein